MSDVVTVDVDPYSEQMLRDPGPFYAALGQAPLVRIPAYGVWASGHRDTVAEILTTPEVFCSSRGAGITDFKKEKPWRPPSIITEADGEQHARTRRVLARVLSVQALNELRATFETEAARIVDELVARDTFDANDDLAVGFLLKVFPDAVGLAADGRENLIDYGDMVFNMFGPRNERADRTMDKASSLLPWIAEHCQRAELAPGGFGAGIYEFVESGDIAEDEAALLVRSLLSAGLDTTILSVGIAMALFARFPDQWDLLHADPDLARDAIDEVLRFEAPLHSFYRTVDQPTELAGLQLEDGDKILLVAAAANHDPQYWVDPDTFDIRRGQRGQLAFGLGIHVCIGRALAMLEMEVLLRAIAERVGRIEQVGESEPRINNSLHGYSRLPIRFIAA